MSFFPRVILMAGLLSTITGALGCASAATWTETAAQARRLGPDQLQQAERALARMDRPRRVQAEALLDRLAGEPATAAGLKAAADALAHELPDFADPSRPTDGTDPNVGAVRLAAQTLFQGMVLRAGAAARQGSQPADDALALLQTVQALPGFDDASKGLLREELRQGLGAELYVAAMKANAPPPG